MEANEKAWRADSNGYSGISKDGAMLPTQIIGYFLAIFLIRKLCKKVAST
jgi:hypothetical protein